jgi:hypothetical protein
VDGGALLTIASGQPSPKRIAVDGTFVYWNNDGDGTIVRDAKDGGPAVQLAAVTAPPGCLAIDTVYVYFADQTASTISRVQIDGGALMLLGTTPDAGRSPPRLAVDAVNVYWSGVVNGSIMQLPKDGGAFFELSSGNPAPSGIATDGTHVYFGVTGVDGGVYKVPVGGTTVTAIATSQNKPGALAVSGPFVVWANAGDGTIMRALK